MIPAGLGMIPGPNIIPGLGMNIALGNIGYICCGVRILLGKVWIGRES
jgi:hypothetical protein